jgi:hypothetical protein
VAIFGDVAHARHDAVAAVLGIGERAVINHLNEPARACPEGAVALPRRVRGRDEHHLLARDELTHLDVQMVEDLATVERSRTLGRRGPLL